MKCLIPNSCEDKQLCCAFFKKKNCSDRCQDDYTKCRYFDPAKYKCERKAEDKNVSG